MISFDLRAAIISGDMQQRNRAYSILWRDEMVRNKIKAWATDYRLQEMEPDDILQEALLKLDTLVLEGIFQGKSKITTFLLGIALNMIRDKTRLVKRHFFKGILTDNDCPDAETVADQLLYQEDREARQELDREVALLTQQLEPECQEALRLQYYEKMCMKEIAPLIGEKNDKQAKKKASECRKALRALCQRSATVQRLTAYLDI
jgi:RNA polymerase sigma factor (sigma-70 family)